MKQISRREFGALVATGVVTSALTGRLAFSQSAMAAPVGAAAITANDILQRIRENVGVPWREQTVDTVKAGDPTTTITGVITTSLATIEVLRQAISSQANLIITSGTTFYGRADSRTPAAGRGGGAGRAGGAGAAGAAAAPTPPPPPPPANPVYDEKNRIIDSNGLVIFRLSDHWRARTPDAFGVGLADRIFGEGTFPDSETPYVYDIPARPLDTLASDVKYRLGGRGGIRVIGDPSIRIRRVAILPGTKAIADILRALPQVDAIIAGEIREWESSEYMRDVAFSGQQKALILVGRVLSEDPGMALSATWLGGLVPEVPVRHISAGDPYWRPVS